MKEILDKMSSYNLFNYLFPGVLFVVIADHFTSFSFIQSDIVIGLVLYYFIGLLISRFGSLIVEPFLRWIKLLKFADYPKYLAACKTDPLIETLSEVNNTYRTLIAVFLSLFLLKGYDLLITQNPILKSYSLVIVITLCLILFIFSYRKQTNYISKRVMKK